MSLFETAQGYGGKRGKGKKVLLPKICDIYPAMMKLGTVITLPEPDSKNIQIT